MDYTEEDFRKIAEILKERTSKVWSVVEKDSGCTETLKKIGVRSVYVNPEQLKERYFFNIFDSERNVLVRILNEDDRHQAISLAIEQRADLIAVASHDDLSYNSKTSLRNGGYLVHINIEPYNLPSGKRLWIFPRIA